MKIWDLEGSGEWTYTIKMLNSETHVFSIYKMDHTILGMGYSDFNLTDGSNWFNTTFSQPRIPVISAPAALFSVAYNLNTSKYGFLVFDQTRYLNLVPGMIPITQNFIDYMKLEGPGNLNVVFWGTTYEALVTADQKMTVPGANILGEIHDMATQLWSITSTLYSLFYWFVLGGSTTGETGVPGFVLFLLLLETGMMAVYINQSKDIFQFYKKFINGNKSLFAFLSQFVYFVIRIGETMIIITATAISTAAGVVLALLGALI
jgi:hypothetical protein